MDNDFGYTTQRKSQGIWGKPILTSTSTPTTGNGLGPAVTRRSCMLYCFTSTRDSYLSSSANLFIIFTFSFIVFG
ncbi:hypothetical protein DFA_07729 [Cavenderia fasciculata]|uniref:Transmembrane protein n=1 Tax=Cavenderia fasciculata TaxID=261658 RepID=F4Q329_CACFS|nr:uncharacterized protein DFA_07729 [Cavenderia fasciculata]EGG16751.1 hypothetical protein DFA_07729 [Cavenderia fasciculata]|eukprot:XP_004355225.1 hypothetical protein DFA_07729 [Cavenderia fasciculata]